MGGPQGQSERLRNISPPPGFDPRTVQRAASCYTDHVIPAHRILKRLLDVWKIRTPLVMINFLAGARFSLYTPDSVRSTYKQYHYLQTRLIVPLYLNVNWFLFLLHVTDSPRAASLNQTLVHSCRHTSFQQAVKRCNVYTPFCGKIKGTRRLQAMGRQIL
jgi:hypothetical protein